MQEVGRVYAATGDDEDEDEQGAEGEGDEGKDAEDEGNSFSQQNYYATIAISLFLISPSAASSNFFSFVHSSN